MKHVLIAVTILSLASACAYREERVVQPVPATATVVAPPPPPATVVVPAY